MKTFTLAFFLLCTFFLALPALCLADYEACKKEAADKLARCVASITKEILECQRDCTNDNQRVDCERQCQDTEPDERSNCFEEERNAVQRCD